MKGCLLKLAILLISCFFSGLTFAATTAWISDPLHPQAQVRLTVFAAESSASAQLPALLEVRLQPGWKTYWRNPGVAGAAPQLQLSAHQSVRQVRWQWPIPTRFVDMGIETLGYQSQAAFPLMFELLEARSRDSFDGVLHLSFCQQLCVQGRFKLQLSWERSRLQPASADLAYQQALQQVPRQNSPHFAVESVRFEPNSQQIRLKLQSLLGWDEEPSLFVDIPGYSFHTRLQQLQVHDNTLNAVFDLEQAEPGWQHRPLRITVASGGMMGEYTDPIDEVPVQAGLGWALLMAFLGGLILNVMPCVLPVLGMKLSSLLLVEKQQRRQVRFSFLASALGILVAFWALAVMVLVARGGEAAVGWGTQFQNPWFIGVLLLLAGGFTLSLLGLWNLQLPLALRDRLVSAGQAQWLQHFTTGIAATLLATPCTAPFLVTAVTAAWLASPVQLVAIFTGLAVGMALPWLLVALFPQSLRLLPKPGRWMLWLRNFFGLLMALTVFWLMSLLRAYLPPALIVTLASLWLLLLLALLWRAQRKTLLSVLLGSVILLLAGWFWFSATSEAALDWQPFTEQRLDQAVSEGQTVLVVMTADWCVTCQFNELHVFRNSNVIAALQHQQVIILRGDLTHKAPALQAYLATFERYGVPYYRLYGAGAPSGVELPVLLTPSQLLKSLSQYK